MVKSKPFVSVERYLLMYLAITLAWVSAVGAARFFGWL